MFIGLGIGVFHPVSLALVAKWSPKETRGIHMGDFIALGDVGRIGIATALTFIIAFIGWQYTTMLYAVIALFVGFLVYLFYFKKSEHITQKEKTPVHVTLHEIIANKKFLLANCTAFFDAFASSSLFLFLPFLLLNKDVDPSLLGSFAAAFFLGTFIGKSALGRIADKFGNAKVFMISELLMAVFLIALASASALPIIIGCSIILGMFTKGTVPVLQTMVSDSGEHHGNFEKIFAVNTFLTRIA